jgi:hypothetical protein
MSVGSAVAVVWGAILLALAALVAFVIGAGKLRRRMRANAAAELGLAVVPDAKPFTEEEAERRTLLRLFNSDNQPGALRGVVDGVDTAIFDHAITLQSGFHSAPKIGHQTVAAFHSAPEGAEFLLTARRKQDWDKPDPSKTHFDFHPDFARRYSVSTQQPDALRRLLTAEKLVFLARLAEKEEWTIWCGEEWFVLYRQGKTVRAGKLGEFLKDAQRILATLTSSESSATAR